MRIVLALALALLVVGGAVAVPMLVEGDGDPVAVMGPPNGTTSGVTDEGVQEYDVRDNTHTTGEVDYPQSPPVAGQHDSIWLECGVYDRPVRDENVVHSLEHGTVWITYTSEVSEEDLDTLVEVLPDEGILSPYADQPAPVMITVWNRQLALDEADRGRLEDFIAAYGHGETSPEPMASCRGGVQEFAGGDPVRHRTGVR